MTKFIVFIAGSIVGSFLNVCIHRLPRGESIIRPSSRCPGCGKAIPWYDNIPIFSFLLLGARCRFCKTRIRIRYFIVEVLTAALFLILYLYFGLSAKFFANLVFASLLIIATFADFEHQEIPDQVSIGGICAGVMSSLFTGLTFLGSLIGALTGGAIIYLAGVLGKAAFKKEAMGGGDVKLMAMIGAFLGWKLVILTFFIAPFFGAIVGITLKIRTGQEVIPYGPYLSLGALIALFFGDAVLRLLFSGLL